MSGNNLLLLNQFAGCSIKARYSLTSLISAIESAHDRPDSVFADAGSFSFPRASGGLATVDVIGPVVADAATFGEIAVSHVLGDIFCVGGIPFAALNILGIPREGMSEELTVQLLSGARRQASEAGVAIIGGHTYYSEALCFGQAVLGFLPGKTARGLSGGMPGDALVCTKPIGMVRVATAYDLGSLNSIKAIPLDAYQSVIEQLRRDDSVPSQIFSRYDIRCCTDVTGFGLLGHLVNMARASNVSAMIRWEDIPFAPASDLVEVPYGRGCLTASSIEDLEDLVEVRCALAKRDSAALYESQTAGGLLAAVPADESKKIVQELQIAGFPYASIIGFLDQPSADGTLVIVV